MHERLDRLIDLPQHAEVAAARPGLGGEATCGPLEHASELDGVPDVRLRELADDVPAGG
jgi:hypothetical protein